MLLNTDYIEPADLTGYTRGALANLPINQFSLRRWLPDIEHDDLEYRFERGGEGLTEAANYRGYDTESQISGRAGRARVRGELPPISRKIRFGEYDRLRQRQLQARIGPGLEGDAVRLMRQIAARVELARGEALYKGKLELAENGIIADVDFGRAAGHTVTAATVWSDPDAPILSNLRSWRATYKSTNDGEEPGAIVTSEQVVEWMLFNTEFRALVGTMAGTPSLVTRTQLNAVLQAHSLPPIYEYDTQVRVGGTAQRVIPADRVLLLPAPEDQGGTGDDDFNLGSTLWGTTAEALDPRFQIDESEAPGIVAGAYSDEDPVALWTKASAIVLPILANPNLSFAADVL